MITEQKKSKVLGNKSLSQTDLGKSYDLVHIIKYMGSKKPILDFVIDQILEITPKNGIVCDLFSGSCSISGGLRNKYDVISNDIQTYSEILAQTYFSDFNQYTAEEVYEDIERTSNIHVRELYQVFPELFDDLYKLGTVTGFANFEKKQRDLIDRDFNGVDYYLYTKYYSGTYWSFQQCVWIDSLRRTAEAYRNTPIYYAILSSLMYAMSYTSQSTGHFAQYRDGRTDEAIENILKYRQKSISKLFKKKFAQLLNTYRSPSKDLTTYTLDFKDCLEKTPEGATVYADPPYAPVHYSRFYHALETLVRYDYPDLEHKGRYRMDRHQSPFSQKSNAPTAFSDMFERITKRKCQMVLSYSGTGVISIEDVMRLLPIHFSKAKYIIKTLALDYKHSTMGRAEDKDRDVIEYLIITKLK
ncbi:MAG: DNA adenine methylase [Bacteroidetes bacterium]|nr:DNA adenine methylase [Bacteroidota bacterium]